MRPVVGYLALALFALTPACHAPAASTASRPIVGGTTDTTHTNVVSLTWSGFSMCTASVISQRAVVTAAHCVAAVDDPQELAVYIPPPGGESSGRTIAVTDGAIHPLYDDRELVYDIAYLLLAEDAQVPAVRIRREPLEPDWVDRMVTLVGFGIIASNAGGGGVRRVTQAPLTQITPYWIKYGDLVHSTCQGDSGGPAFLEIDGHEVQIGVTSFGSGNCADGGVDTRVDIAANDFLAPYLDDDHEPPELAVTAPAPGATVLRGFTLEVSADDANGIAQIDVALDGSTLHRVTAPPYELRTPAWLPLGVHTFVVTAHDASWNETAAALTLNVQREDTACVEEWDCPPGLTCRAGTCAVAAPGTAPAGTPCTAAAECRSAACVTVDATERVCAAVCDLAAGLECEDGGRCAAGFCIPAASAGTAGAPCLRPEDCAAGHCVDAAEGFGYCSQPCDADGACPGRMTCERDRFLEPLCGRPDFAAPSPSATGCTAGGPPAAAPLLALLLLALVLRLGKDPRPGARGQGQR